MSDVHSAGVRKGTSVFGDIQKMLNMCMLTEGVKIMKLHLK